MKKLYAFAAAALATVSMNAQVYLCGNWNSDLGWLPESPKEFVENEQGDWQLTVHLQEFKLSTAKGSWDVFNAKAMSVNKGAVTADMIGTPQPLMAWGENATLPWEGDWTFVVSADYSTLTCTTTTPAPTDYTKAYILGGMNGWSANAKWLMSTTDGVTYTFTCEGATAIPANTEFKIGASNWSGINYTTGGTVTPDGTKKVVPYNSGANMKVTSPFEGEIKLVLVNGQNKSAELYFTPAGEEPEPPTPPVTEKHLYITGPFDGWNPTSPKEFSTDEMGNFTVTVNSQTFKMSTAKGDWDSFNSGALSVEGANVTADMVGIAQPLVAWGENTNMPWDGVWTINVAADLSTATFTTTTPAPTGYTEAYLLGEMNGWTASENWKMSTEDGVTYTFTCEGATAIPASKNFKVGSTNWAGINYSIGGEATADGEAYEALYNIDNGTFFSTDFEGTVTLVLVNGQNANATLAFTPKAAPVPGPEALYITGNFDGWNPEEPTEFSRDENGNFTVTINDQMVKISPLKGDWDTFNEGSISVYSSVVTSEQVGLALPLYPSVNNTNLPWEGEWTITIAADLSTVVFTTTTPEPTGITDAYVVGDMTDTWQFLPEWKMSTEDGVTYTFVCEGETIIPAGAEFKLAADTWNGINYAGEVAADGTPYTVEFNSTVNISLPEDFEGTITLVLVNGKNLPAELTLTPKAEPVPGPEALYITGGFDGWNAASPTEFGRDEKGNFTITINDQAFKMSTSKGDWDAFNAGAISVEGAFVTADMVGEALPLIAWGENTTMPWEGEWTITVSADCSTATFTTTTPAPTDYTAVYVVGGMTNWTFVDSWKMETEDGVTYTFTCDSSNTIAANTEFKLAASNWNGINYGGPAVADGEANLVQFGGDNIKLDETFEGTIKLVLINGQNKDAELYLIPTLQTGVEGVEAASADVEYFNLQGMPVANPTTGIYIRRQGNTVTKVTVK